MTVYTRGDFIMSPTRKSSHGHHDPISDSHYPEIKLTSPCLIEILQSARLGGNKYKLLYDIGLIRPRFEFPTFHMGSMRPTDLATALGALGSSILEDYARGGKCSMIYLY